MKRKYDADIEQEVWDDILGLSRGFVMPDGKRFAYYPVSLGKSILLSRLMQTLGINEQSLKLNPTFEAMRIAREKKGTACRMIAICTLKNRSIPLEDWQISKRADYFSRNLSDEDITKFLLLMLRNDRTEAFVSYYGLDVERKDQAKIAKVKNKGGNTVSFGGKSPYGAIIGTVCERFGWSFDYVVWSISYTRLRMLLADAANSVYLSDEEKKAARIHAGEEVLDMDDPKSWAKIKSMKWD